MNATSTRRVVPAVAALALGLSLSACGGASEPSGDNAAEQVSGSVAVDGSSTVYPMSVAAAELLREEQPKVQVTVGESGTGGGFEKFCAGETDLSDASRPIKDDEEAPVCEKAGIEYTQLQVATDALTIAVHPDLAVDCLTVDQVGKLFIKGSKIKNWKELDPSFPDEKISFFIPGTDSGTYDYMANDVFDNESEELRADVESSEDDNVLVQGVSGTEGAVGFFGFSYFEENSDKLKALEVDGGEGCVAPSVETAQDGSYTPLARPLFVYANNAKYTENEATKSYLDFYVENLATIAEETGFIPLSDELYEGTKAALSGIK
ncbi:PstS family phosphate ABC transporter substrate-binding protein [Nocardioides sp.]|uniref:PstS family phosphate ABC transporter substrate-binding protein n=1 Tax=Nocardioides sp. TaxID=35761 RepID=UPI002B7206F7|nr:PstS family phosphate ABC transporter substrate-binding protein [Nocardioides sp.]HSX67349.1 PstS family phosphate ABC transporter substrate-binding protein [Nocardioides sp.]